MSLISEIQLTSISPSADVPSLLRMCKLLAARLKNPEFATWVECELNGYPDGPLPPYRVVQVMSYGNFAGPYGSGAQHLAIPLSSVPDELRKQYAIARLDQPVSTYMGLEESEQPLQLPWVPEAALAYGSKAVNNMQCISAWKSIPPGAIKALFDSIKTKVLGFVIDLDEVSPDAGDSVLAVAPIPTDKVTQIVNNHFTGPVGNVANGGSHFSQTANIAIQSNNWDELRNQLSRLGIDGADLDELHSDLQVSIKEEPSTRLQRVSRWIGHLACKAVDKGADMTVDVAAAVMAKLLQQYVGLPPT